MQVTALDQPDGLVQVLPKIEIELRQEKVSFRESGVHRNRLFVQRDLMLAIAGSLAVKQIVPRSAGGDVDVVARHWAEVGFGTPIALHLFYVVKIGLYILAAWLLALTTTGINGFTDVAHWYAEPIVFEKVVLYTMLFEVVGLGCGRQCRPRRQAARQPGRVDQRRRVTC